MTKDDAIRWAGGSVSLLAQRLGITRQAISQWNHDRIPRLRELQITVISSAVSGVSESNVKL